MLNIYIQKKAGFDMSFDEFKGLCKEAWKENYNFLKTN